MQDIQPFVLSIPDSELEDLRRRLRETRWPEKEPVPDWSQGAPLARVKALCDYWLNDYDWRRCEAVLNGYPQYRTVIDGLGIHFLHIRSPEPDALPLLMTHGWPGSIVEFLKVIGPLTDPAAHGGNPRDAFDLVLPSLPGYGFSDKPTETGWGPVRTARAWLTLMERLGYARFVKQGGDWGAMVTKAMAAMKAPQCLAVHLNMPLIIPAEEEIATATDEERAILVDQEYFLTQDSAYLELQRTRPQTIGYGLADSPAGQASWIYEKLQSWSDHNGQVEEILSMDEILDNIMMYWLPNTAASSARFYQEGIEFAFTSERIDTPVGISNFPKEVYRSSRRWADRVFGNIIHWNSPHKGGHFAAFEQPELFVQEVRDCFRQFQIGGAYQSSSGERPL